MICWFKSQSKTLGFKILQQTTPLGGSRNHGEISVNPVSPTKLEGNESALPRHPLDIKEMNGKKYEGQFKISVFSLTFE